MLTMYPACFYKEDDGYSVIFPDLNYLATCGKDLNEAMEMAIDCLAGYAFDCQLEGEKLPKVSNIESIDAKAIGKELDPEASCEDCFVNMVSVEVESYAREHFDKPIRKSLTIPAWLNKTATELGINFSQTLKEALIDKIYPKAQINKMK